MTTEAFCREPGRPMADSHRQPPPNVDPRVLCTTMLDAARAARIGVTVTHVDGGAPRNIYVSEVAATILGWPMDELMGGDAMIHIAAEDRPRMRERFDKRVGGENGQVTYDLTAIGKDGTRTPIRVTATDAIFDGRRSVVAFVVDLAARRAAEEARMHAEARFRDLIEKAPEPIAILDKLHFLYANPAFATVLGYRCVDDLYPVPLSQIVHAKDLALLETRSQLLIDHGRQPPPYVYTCLRPDGSTRLLEATSVPFQYEGKPAILTMGRDVTERRMLEGRLIQADRLAALGTLAAGVAHEINNPLAYLILNLDWIARKVSEGAVGPEVGSAEREGGQENHRDAAASQGAEWMTEMLREARGGAERVAAIVRHLRSFSRADDDTRRAVDLSAVVRTAIKLTGQEIRPRARITTVIEPIRSVWANEGRLEQVAVNLLLNAGQALPEARAATNEIRVVVRPSSDASAVLEISDNGDGIAPDVLPRIFDPFFTTKPPGLGTGLGLSICHGIVASLGGRITVDSVPGEGTTFRVVLPTTYLPQDEPHTPIEPAPLRGEARARVLVIDDEVQIASTLRELLAADHDVLATTNASDALAAVRAGSDFDVIFCALAMPGMDGITLFSELAQVRPGLEKRIVFTTAGAFTKRAAEFLASVDNRHLEKPFSLGLVERIVREMRRSRPVDENDARRAASARGC